ncbi:hypothetical protein MPTK1_2g00270 [Marchantia polymorpha subsp. ruderalis]|uniref:Uncharacterized protein n=2 Tax=Marchantia polymorpha TaxID=3197 RepID=A0A176WLL7_MARPO|nr:hypothetical protein AXG93_3105s1090 [Marchantia polymorpha subsp. ruderalis]PTQ42831.1 hypothetical protein MARPO_0028s0124 [Marchantia polymorpha]BBN00566.1 hypothetical protein Mp_2g00270 [Marchantia polymorpha subsp. ruderalis]|eukprot:PTQ42831.1 hypothetical protein MARPO_0028s0124 [Marchantia polymorpha]
MAATSSAQLSLQWVSLQAPVVASSSSSSSSSSVRCSSLSLKQRCVLSSVGSSGTSSRCRNLQAIRAKKVGKDRNGGVAEAVESPTLPVESSEADDMWMGKKLEGIEPDFWEGEKWEAFGFAIQYMWLFGVLISLVACGVAVRTYNTGATDFKDTAVFKEAMDSQVEMDSSVFDQVDTEGFTDPGQAPPIE